MIKRLIRVELYKIRKIRTFILTGIFALIYGAAASCIIGVNGMPAVDVASLITNSSLILLIAPILIDYTSDCANGFFQDAVSHGIKRNVLFIEKVCVLYVQSLLIYTLLYGSLFVTFMLRGLACNFDLFSFWKLLLFTSCVFSVGFMLAVFLEQPLPLTVGCAVLSITLSAIGTVLSKFHVSGYYIYGMNGPTS